MVYMKNIYYKNNNNYILNNNSNNNIQKAGTPETSPYPYDYIKFPTSTDEKHFIFNYNIIAFYGDTDRDNAKNKIDQIYDYGILGNFYKEIIEITYDNNLFYFPNSEAAFHASKFVGLWNERLATQINNISDRSYKNKYPLDESYDNQIFWKHLSILKKLIIKLSTNLKNINVLIYFLSNLDRNNDVEKQQSYFHGYKSFTKYRMLEKILSICDKKLTTTYGIPDNDLYYKINDTKLYKLSPRVMRMIIILRIKFKQESNNAKKLLQTNNRYLLEYNMGYAPDNSWSDGQDGNGLNLLGIVLIH